VDWCILPSRFGNGIPGHTTRAPPYTSGGMVRTGDLTITSPPPWPQGHNVPGQAQDRGPDLRQTPTPPQLPLLPTPPPPTLPPPATPPDRGTAAASGGEKLPPTPALRQGASGRGW
jgi:hypothetical protein